MLAAERGQPGERYLISGATLTSHEALELVTGSPACGATSASCPRRSPPRRRRGRRARLPRARAQAAGCREMVNTMLHGHRYDGSRAVAELGLRYTPVEDTFRRTIEWARAEGLVHAGSG